MDISIPKGTKGLQQLQVTKELTAATYGSGLVEVFATPAMIALMERTSQLSVQNYLPDDFITVGTLINVKHLKATPVGLTVRCVSELIEQDGRRLVFKVTAQDDQAMIGEGIHERFIVNQTDFMKKLG